MTVVVERDVEIPLRDGTVTRADVWRPAGDGRWPALLQRTPYDKGASLISVVLVGLEPLHAVEAGFCVVVQDTRGRAASDGSFNVFTQEADDGADSIEWVAAQDWCDGDVCMHGASYIGTTQLLAATRGPPALRAIAPSLTGADYYDGWTYQGGALQLGFVLLWAMEDLGAAELFRRRANGEDVDALEVALFELLTDPWLAYRSPCDGPMAAVRELVPDLSDWLAHAERDAYWAQRSVAEHYDEIEVPSLHIGAWHDILLPGTLRNYGALRASGKAEQRLLIGPWAHGNLTDSVGEADYGPAGSAFALDLTAVQLDWFEHVLDGTAAELPPVRVFVMGRNEWRDEEEWPPARARTVDLFLRSDANLSREPPADGERPDRFRYDPADPVPTAGGATLLPGAMVSRHAGPKEMRTVEERADVLVYTSAMLTDDLEITGEVTAVLYAATTGIDTDWTARLVDVDQDGRRALGIVDGIIRARFRDGLDSPAPIEPGEVYRYEIVLGATCLVVPAGHRLRVQVSSSNLPRFDRNPNTGSSSVAPEPVAIKVADQTVFHDASRPSAIRLPIAAGGLP